MTKMAIALAALADDGRVLGPSGAVAGAKVLLRPARSMGNVVARVQSDADGHYAIDGLLPGAYQLRAESNRLASGAG